MNKPNPNVDWREFRKSTHLASADISIMKSKGHNLIFTIAKSQREFAVNVNGKKEDGNFIYFTEPGIKPMKLNSTNMDRLAGFARANGIPREESNIVGNWVGLTIELYVDHNVRFGRDIKEGIRISPVQPQVQQQLPNFTPDMFEQAKQANATLDQIAQNYFITQEIAQQYEQYRTA